MRESAAPVVAVPSSEGGMNIELMVLQIDISIGPQSRLTQWAQVSRYLKSSKKVCKDGIRPSKFCVRDHMIRRSSSLNSANAWPLRIIPQAFSPSVRDLPGASSCRNSTVFWSIFLSEAWSEATKEDQKSQI